MPEFALPNPEKPVVLDYNRWHSVSELIGSYGASLSSGRAPVRTAPTDGAECDTRLTFGMFFQILEVKPAAEPAINPTAAWLKIRIINDYRTREVEPGNLGWIESHRATVVDGDWAMGVLKKRRFKVFGDRDYSKLALPSGDWYQGVALTVNSRLPEFKGGSCNFETPTGKLDFSVLKLPSYKKSPLYTDTRDGFNPNHKLREQVWNKLGAPYVWGWDDCSAFVQDIGAHLKVSLPRNSGAQRSAGSVIQIPDGSEAAHFFENVREGACLGYKGHIGIILQTKRGALLAHHKQRVRIDPLDKTTGQPPTVIGKKRAQEVVTYEGF